MTDNNTNDAQGYEQPTGPNADLKSLDRLVGTWDHSGEVRGTSTFEWMEGGYFLIQRVNLEQYGQKVRGHRGHRASASVRGRAERGHKEPLLRQHGQHSTTSTNSRGTR